MAENTAMALVRTSSGNTSLTVRYPALAPEPASNSAAKIIGKIIE